MKIRRTERDYYALKITTTPPLSGAWQASFDNGINWVTGSQDSDGFWTWLVAGPNYVAADVNEDPDDTQATITKTTIPLLRLADDPILKVEAGPKISFV